MSNRQRIRRHATNGAGRGQLVETVPEGVESTYYNQVVRHEDVISRDGNIVLSREAVQSLGLGFAVLAGIRGYFRPDEHARFCQRCDEALHFIGDILTMAGEGERAIQEET